VFQYASGVSCFNLAPVAGLLHLQSDESHLFVRVDGSKTAQFGIELENGPAKVKTARGRILEMETARSGNRFRLTIAQDGLPALKVPADGWIEITPGK